MAWGNPFKSAWNSATDAAKQKAAQIATGVKQAVSAATQWAKDTTAKLAQDAGQKAGQVVKAAQQTGGQVAKAIQQKASAAVSEVKKTVATTAGKVSQAFNNVKKTFDQVAAKKPVLACPLPQALRDTPGDGLRNLVEAGFGIKDAFDLSKLLGPSVGIMRRAVGAARQTVRPWTLPTVNQFKFAYSKAFTFSRGNVVVEAIGGGVSVALGGVASGINNLGKYRSGQISGANYGGRIAHGAVQGAVEYAAGAAAAPAGAVIGAVLPPVGGALGGSAIGYKIGKALGGDQGKWTGAAVGAAVGAVAGLIPGAGPALGAIGAHMWAGEGAGEVMNRFIVDENTAGHLADAAVQKAGHAINSVKNFFKW
ncbi:MAG: hypothetical protein ACR2HX_13320 [Pyrinomonadaceae bacterium]